MIRKFGLVLGMCAAGSCFAPLHALGEEQDVQKYLQQGSQSGIQVHHWVLAKPNGRPITVMDLAKKLEVAFYRTYPEYANNQQVRLQFFQAMWRQVLAERIHNQLMLADAEEMGAEVNDADIRQEMQMSFGPNVVQTLDELGLTYAEAWEMIKEEVTVGQIQGYRVQRKAFSSITPDKLKVAYENFVSEFVPSDEWEYQLLTIRHQNNALAEKGAQEASAMMAAQPGISLDNLYHALAQKRDGGDLAPSLNLRVSDREKRELESLAPAYREILERLAAGTTTPPIEQQSRDGSSCFRIFHLASHTVEEVPAFDSVVGDLRNQLMQVAYAKYQQEYLTYLREHYGIDEDYLATMIPDDFEPFSL